MGLVIVLVFVCVECGKRKNRRNRKVEDNDKPASCSFQKDGMVMTLRPGYVFLSADIKNECEIGQCLPGGKVEFSRIPVNALGVFTQHELFIHSPSGSFAGKSCKLCTCIDAGERKYRSCKDFGDVCSNPI